MAFAFGAEDILEAVPGACDLRSYIASETIEPGNCIARVDGTANQVALCRTAVGEPQAGARVMGFSMNKALTGQPLVVCVAGKVRIRPQGSPLLGPTPELYYVDAFPAIVSPEVSLGEWVSWIGYGVDAYHIIIEPGYSDFQQSA